MLTSDVYGKPLSSLFNTAITSIAQKVKPRIIIDWLDSRHLDNLVVTTNDAHSNTSYPEMGFFFDKTQAFNGINRQSFKWAVCDAKDQNGDVITADGQWYAMPSLVTNDLNNTDMGTSLEFGWWSNSVSNSSPHISYSGYGFVTNPYIQATFTERKVNKIRIVTSEFHGAISNYLLEAHDADLNVVLSEQGFIKDGSYYQDHIISEATSQDVAKIKLTVYSTKNPQDRARVQEIIPLYEVDITDYVIDYSFSRSRDVHQSSLPIGGSETAQASINIDNTSKDFSIFNTNSLFGKYMKKDLKVQIGTGWRVKKDIDNINAEFITTNLSSNINSTANTLPVLDAENFPDGGAGNYFTVILDKGTQSEEIVLCSLKQDDRTIIVSERGYAGSLAKSHNSSATVTYDLYEYVSGGTYYIDEWSVSSSSMSVSVSLNDWSKYLSEKTINNGFFMQNAYVGDAVENLLMRANFPSADIKKLNKYNTGARIKGAIANYSFNEETIDRSGNNIIPGNGLRSRFWVMPTGSEINVRDILADAIDKELSPLDKALGLKSFVSPSYTALSTDISVDPLSAIELVDFTFETLDGETHSEYFNGVFDGYYIPRDSGVQYLVVNIRYGGVRIYLDDNLILNEWRNNTTTGGALTRFESNELDLIAGSPRKIRIEFFHAFDDNNGSSFCLELYKAVGIGADEILDATEFCTITAIDSIGSRNAPFIADANQNNHRNNGVYIANPLLGQPTGLTSDPNNKSVSLASNSYIRIPYHSSIDMTNSSSYLYTGDWAMEVFARFNNGSFSSDGEYISNWSNSTPTTGFEFFHNSTSHGFKVRTLANSSVVTETVSSNTALLSNTFYHIAVTYSDNSLNYYVNGVLRDTEVVEGTPIAWTNRNITIGGRGASFTDGVGESAPAAFRSFIIDEFALYNKSLSAADVADRYSESNIQPLTMFPFLYGNDESIRSIMDSITLADLGRFYIDEEDNARYEHFYRFFETSIDQHANIQYTISDSTSIIDADYVSSLQCNKVVIPIAGLSSVASGTQSLWRASDPTTLSVVTLTANLTANANVVYVGTTEDPPFPTSGYVKINNEVIKYTSKTANSFNNLERGQFQTTAAAHSINNGNNSKVREAKYYNLKYDKSPAFNVKSPFITGIVYEDPDEIEIVRYIPGAYGAELIIATANSVEDGSIIFAEGINPLTEKVAFASIAGVPVIVTEQNSQITQQSAVNSDSIRKYGLKDMIIESPYINDTVHAQKIADFIISKTQDTVPIVNVVCTAIPKIQLGDKIRVSTMNSFDIINADYWVISQSLNVGDTLQHTLTLRKVV
jgi:hypothetical protein